ncbi:MAG: histidine kinase dimerization/phospho-acceptor domain-containing protein, partial [Verrucomicrobiota bacterium]
MRFFDFGEEWQTVTVGAVRESRDLRFFVYWREGTVTHSGSLEIRRIIQKQRWFHIAAVSGQEGMKLYFNGILVQSNSVTNSFSSTRSGRRNYLGKSVWRHGTDALFHGRMDEVRVWKVARTGEEIRQGMFRAFTGTEPNLVGLWNFDDPAQPGKDSSLHKWHGKMKGAARVVAEALPSPGELALPGIITGRRSEDSKPYKSLVIEVTPRDKPAWSVIIPAGGEKFSLAVFSEDSPMDLRVISAAGERVSRDLTVGGGEQQSIDLQLPRNGTTDSTNYFLKVLLGLAQGSDVSDAELVSQATDELGRLGIASTDVVDVIARNMESESFAVSWSALWALSRLAPSDARSVLAFAKAGAHPNPNHRYNAQMLLRRSPLYESLAQQLYPRAKVLAFVFCGVLAPFAILHLVLFLFQPDRRANLYCGFSSIFAAIVISLSFLMRNGMESETAVPVMCSAFLGLVLSGNLLFYAISSSKPTPYFTAILSCSLILMAVLLCWPAAAHAFVARPPLPNSEGPPSLPGALWFLLSSASGFDIARLSVRAIRDHREGAWLATIGFIVFYLGCSFVLLLGIYGGSLLGFAAYTISTDWILAMAVAGFVGFISISLAREFSRTHQRLQAAHAHLEEANVSLQATNQELNEAKGIAEQARTSADEANFAKSQFLASMSHELRTPLNAIIGYGEMLQEEVQDLGVRELKPDLEKIVAAARHQLGLVNDILDLSKIEAGKMTLFIEEFDVAKLVQEVAATIQPLVAKNSNRLVVECPANIGTMRTDQTK